MSVQGRAEPDRPEEPDPAVAGEPASAPAETPPATGDLAVKPVLDWTEQDWSRWIDGPDTGRLATPPAPSRATAAPDDEPAAVRWAPLGGDEPWADVAVDAAPDASVEDRADTRAGADNGVGTDAEREVGIGAERGVGTEAERGVGNDAGADAGTTSERDVGPDPERGVGTDAGPTSELDVGADRVDAATLAALAEGPGTIGSGEPLEPPASPADTDHGAAPVSASADEPAVEDEWAGVADHPWWDSAPAPESGEEGAPEPEPAGRVDVPPDAPETDVDAATGPPVHPDAPETDVDAASGPPVHPDPPERATEGATGPLHHPGPPPVAVGPDSGLPLLAASSHMAVESSAAPLSARQGPEPIAPRETLRPPTRTTRPMPAGPSRRDVAGPALPSRAEPRHRVRSAFGLLGVAIMVGAVMAGLVTVAIFALTVALRHAAG